MNWYKLSQLDTDNYSVGDKFEMGTITDFPFSEGVPSQEKSQDMKRWLGKNKDIYLPSYIILYHGASLDDPILEEGLKPTTPQRRRKSYQSQSGYVYLSNTPERAKTFGELSNMGRCIVYQVVVAVKDLKPDLDQLNNLRATGVRVGNSVEESIVYGGGARLKGSIPPHSIRLHSKS